MSAPRNDLVVIVEVHHYGGAIVTTKPLGVRVVVRYDDMTPGVARDGPTYVEDIYDADTEIANLRG